MHNASWADRADNEEGSDCRGPGWNMCRMNPTYVTLSQEVQTRTLKPIINDCIVLFIEVKKI